MNIFVTSQSPYKCAKYLDNKRLIKMCLETAQILSTALVLNGCKNQQLYKPTHINHPCAKWVRQTKRNYLWSLAHFNALCEEYNRRYGKIHASFRLFKTFVENKNILPHGKLTKFPNCAANQKLGIDFKHLPVFTAYRMYLFERFKLDKHPPICKI